MRGIHLSTAVLVLFAVAFSCLAQEAGEAGKVQEKLPADSPAAAPAMPVEVVFESSVGNVLFPHSTHLKFGCSACHHQIRAGELNTPHPGYMASSWINCQTCHDANSAARHPYYSCANCHHSELSDIADETLSAKVVIHQSCWKCHKSGTGAEASAGCGDCHVKGEE